MLYYFLKIIVRIFTRIFYRNPLVLNLKKVPLDSPLIIASNHPNALCDPCSIAVFSKQRIHFLARGDVFQNKFLYWIFVKQLGMVPIYRLLEGAENLYKNEETFRISTEKLKQKKTILMFSEGICIQERRLRKLKKGTARIAFTSEESADWNLGLKIIPVGLNYNRPEKFRSDMVINYGTPFEVAQFRELYQQDKAVAINEFTKHLEQQLSELVVHIANPQNDEFVLQLEEISASELQNGKTKEELFRMTQKLVKTVNSLGEEISLLREKTKSYFLQLKKFNISDATVKFFSRNKFTFPKFLFRLLLLLICFPFYIFGLLNNFIPHLAGFLLAKRIVKQVEFHASVHMYSSGMLYLILYPIQILTVALLFKNWCVLGAYVVLLPLTGLFSLKYHQFIGKIFSDLRCITLNRNQREELIKTRREMAEEIKMKFSI